ncbi:hypothetical protein [Paenibacillus senegalensis]|uniref:hypothetical protein n=1 Tax=Paenibacillus senegalensis TaxID=1465766 RepID=UPI00028A1DD3|nr:hypothetical protein [Paenibacillus senegalensis]
MKISGDTLSPQDIERRYELLSRRVHLKLLQGTLTDLEEVEFRQVDRHYKEWLQQERTRKLAEYREHRYGRFGSFAGIAEQIDEFLFYYKFHVIFLGLFVVFLLAAIQSYNHFQHMKLEAAAQPNPDVTVTLVGDFSDLELEPEAEAIRAELAAYLPDSWQLGFRSISIPLDPADEYESAIAKRGALALLSQHSDVYLVDSHHFSKLLQLGYVQELQPWDNYGVNLIKGPLGQIVSYPAEEPLIAAMSISAKKPEKALEFIQAFVTPEVQASYSDPDVIPVHNNNETAETAIPTEASIPKE